MSEVSARCAAWPAEIARRHVGKWWLGDLDNGTPILVKDPLGA